MTTKEEYRRQLGILAGEAMKLQTDMYDAFKDFSERLEKLRKQAGSIWEKIDESLDGE